jgi:hypothetical protein
MTYPDERIRKQCLEYIVNVTIEEDDQEVREAGMRVLLSLCPSQAAMVLDSLVKDSPSRVISVPMVDEFEEFAEESLATIANRQDVADSIRLTALSTLHDMAQAQGWLSNLFRTSMAV